MMFKGKLTKSAGALMLMGALAACGGGGGDNITLEPQTTPLGQLVVLEPAGLAGTYQQVDASQTTAFTSTPTNAVVSVTGLTNTQFAVNLAYDPTNNQLLRIQVRAGDPATATPYACNWNGVNTAPCTTVNVVIDGTSRTITLTNFVVLSATGASMKVNAKLQWKALNS